MASVVYNKFKQNVLKGNFDLVNDTIKCAILMTNTTADDSPDTIEFVGDIGTLDEYNGTNYTAGWAGRISLAGNTVNVSDTTDRGTFSGTDLSVANMGAGTRDIAGILVYKSVTSDALSPVICFVAAAAGVNGDSTTFNWVWHADGILFGT